jgi:hypothetical protein
MAARDVEHRRSTPSSPAARSRSSCSASLGWARLILGAFPRIAGLASSRSGDAVPPLAGGGYPAGSGAHPLVGRRAVPHPVAQSIVGKGTMDPRVAQQIAYICHLGQLTRFGDTVVEHVEHVANAVTPDAQAVAWLHDLFELTPLGRETLRAYGLTAVEEQTLELLTRAPTEPYEDYISRVVRAPGRSGALARTVKLADLDDHLAHGRTPPGAPPYAWARRCVLERQHIDPVPAVAA